VNQWYQGKSKPDFAACLHLARITGWRPAEVLEAAGHDPSLLVDASGDDAAAPTADPIDAKIRSRLRDFESVVASYPKALRLAVIEANIKMAQLFSQLGGEGPVSGPSEGGVSARNAKPTRSDDASRGGLTTS
jgi:hypothetical protein